MPNFLDGPGIAVVNAAVAKLHQAVLHRALAGEDLGEMMGLVASRARKTLCVGRRPAATDAVSTGGGGRATQETTAAQ